MTSVGLLTWAIKQRHRARPPGLGRPGPGADVVLLPVGALLGDRGSMGVAVVLTSMLVRRRGVRRAVLGLAVVLVLLVGADRIFLGVHNLSDVVAGYLLGVRAAEPLAGLLRPDPPLDLGRERAADRRRAQPAQEAGGDPEPDQGRRPGRLPHPGRDAGRRRPASPRWCGGRPRVEDTGYGMAHEAAVSGADLVLAVGGDGTIRAVCEELAGTGIPVGIVPAGTGNLLARNLDIPLYLRSAVDVGLQRPGPRHRHGRGHRRQDGGRDLPGDGRHGLRRRDHGGRQRGHQGQGRLAGLRLVGAAGR